MDELAPQIKSFQDKLQLLLKQYHALQKENRKLKKELEKAQQLQAEQLINFTQLQQQMDVFNLSNGNL